MTAKQETFASLAGQLLIAMPQMEDPRFARSLVYVCAHTPEGAMGLVVNRLFEALTFPDLLDQLDIPKTPECEHIRVHFGGPVDSGRGFVLHSTDYIQDSSLKLDDSVALTATVDVLRDIAAGTGPSKSLMALGYSGWDAGQLDFEMRENAWLTVHADEDLLFGRQLDHKWERAIGKLGFDLSMLSGDAGHA